MENSQQNVTGAQASRTMMIIVVAAFAAYLATFNETFMNVAFTPIITYFGIEAQAVQWLATGYMLAAAVMVPVSAFAYRKIPTKLLFLCTTALLVIGSIIGALSPNFGVLLLGRVLQGLATGFMVPIGMNVTLAVAPKEKLGKMMGMMGAMTTLGPSTSVIIAGFLLSYWEWPVLQWVFAGLSVVSFLLGAFFLPNVGKLTNPKLDVTSVIFVAFALIGILYGISTIFTGNVIIAIAAIVIGALLLFLFIRRQGKIAEPLVNLAVFKVNAFKLGILMNLFALTSIFALNIIIPIFMQSIVGVSALTASLTLFPAIGLSCFIAPIAGHLSDKHGTRLMLPLGFILVCIFAVLLTLFISTGSVWILALLYIPVIGGSSLIIGPVQSVALSQLNHEQYPHGVTIMSTGFQVAGCFGASIFTGVYALFSTRASQTGASLIATGSAGFVAVGLLVALVSLCGLFLAIRMIRYTR
jgi:DHA2 family lincomycin resistance protein-like MFS transporter